MTITKKLKSSHPNLTNFIQILFQVNLNRMWDIWSFFFQLCPTFSFCWDIWSFFFQLCPTFSFCWDICRFSFDYVPHFPFVGTYADFLSDYVPFLISVGGSLAFFLHMSCFRISVGGSSPFLHMSCFRISVGGFLAFFCICPAFGFLWEVSLPFWHMSHLLIPPQNLYQMILICLSTYPVYKFPEQNTLIFLPFRII